MSSNLCILIPLWYIYYVSMHFILLLYISSFYGSVFFYFPLFNGTSLHKFFTRLYSNNLFDNNHIES